MTVASRPTRTAAQFFSALLFFCPSVLLIPLNGARAKVDLQAPAVEINGTYETGVGTSDAVSEGAVTSKGAETRPTLRSGKVLEFIAGVIISQHSGDDKANEYFLHGYNLWTLDLTFSFL